MDFRNKKVTVVGLGESGREAALLLKRAGAAVSVTEADNNKGIRRNASLLNEKKINTEIGNHSEVFLSGAELLVVSPGVEKMSLPVSYAREKNIPIISELELGYLFCKGTIVAVTGTNGKSTVVSLLGEILRTAGIPVNVCGNIGNSLSGEVGKIDKKTIVVLEVSSFQLERIESFRPKISVMLNMTEDHMDRYKSFSEYFDDKKKIFKNQKKSDVTILNYDDQALVALAESKEIPSGALGFSARKKVKGAYLEKDTVFVSLEGKTQKLFSLGNYALSGRHNTENILAATLAATLVGADPAAIEKAVKSFRPLAHRFEKLTTINGVDFINDSKATNIDSTCRALESLDKPVILIAGGKDKGLSWAEAIPFIRNNVKTIILIGETRHEMQSVFEKVITAKKATSLREAVLAAFRAARPGETVLLSPMSSSFDMFRDYKERGELFKDAVEALKNIVQKKHASH